MKDIDVYLSKAEQLRKKLPEVFSLDTLQEIRKSSYKITDDKVVVNLNESAPLTAIICNRLKDVMYSVYQVKQVVFTGAVKQLPYYERIWQKVRQDIRDNTHNGVDIDKAWFSDDVVKIREQNADIMLEGRSDFFNSYIKNNYEALLEHSFAKHGFSLDVYYQKGLRFTRGGVDA